MTGSIPRLVSSLKNGCLARKKEIFLPYSKFSQAILEVLKDEGFLAKVSIEGEKQKKSLICFPSYENLEPVLREIKLISRPGLKRYKKAKEGKKVLGGLGTRIVSTNKGVMTDEQARKKNLGGEVILEVY